MKLAILTSALLLTACMQANPSKPSTQTQEPTETKPPAENQVMCTMDAKQCADGSWVGRSGPTCEFVCPAATDK
jgi:hypothetical protein